MFLSSTNARITAAVLIVCMLVVMVIMIKRSSTKSTASSPTNSSTSSVSRQRPNAAFSGNNNNNNSASVPASSVPPESYITPRVFEIGLEPHCGPYKSANLCRDTVLYPINGLGPVYGNEGMYDDCPYMQFIQPP